MSFDLTIESSSVLEGVKIVTPSVFEGATGNIWTSYKADGFDHLLPGDLSFSHDKFSQSPHNVLRGIHGDHKTWKLTTCVYGEVHQVVVDLRPQSPRHFKFQRFVINRENLRLILIPPGFGNAFYVSSRQAVFHYKFAYSGEYVDAGDQFSVAWNDSRIGINWPSSDPILSDRDRETAERGS